VKNLQYASVIWNLIDGITSAFCMINFTVLNKEKIVITKSKRKKSFGENILLVETPCCVNLKEEEEFFQKI